MMFICCLFLNIVNLYHDYKDYCKRNDPNGQSQTHYEKGKHKSNKSIIIILTLLADWHIDTLLAINITAPSKTQSDLGVRSRVY